MHRVKLRRALIRLFVLIWFVTTTTLAAAFTLPIPVTTTTTTTTTRKKIRIQPFFRPPAHSLSLGCSLDSSFGESAVAIVPPDRAWDTLQRARHVAQDATFDRWPPAIRLFHPFAAALTDWALVLADAIERHNITAPEITLNKWSIVPNWEALQNNWLQQMPHGPESSSDTTYRISVEDAEIQALIAREEEIGVLNKQKRLRRKPKKSPRRDANHTANTAAVVVPHVPRRLRPSRRRQKTAWYSLDDDATDTSRETNRVTPSWREQWEQQQSQYAEFNGPCVIVLEPDEASSRRLQELRRLLLQDPRLRMFDEECSPTLTFGTNVQRTTTTTMGSKIGAPASYRPVVPIAAFSTVSRAIPVARQLRRLWRPLTFTATDLQLLSRQSGKSNKEDAVENAPTFRRETPDDSSNQQWGCDAMVRFVGQEEPMDPHLFQELTTLLCEKGEKGGFCYDSTRCVSPDLENEKEQVRDDFKQWLYEDDDFDEGSVVVIGRTHFFTGEMRLYVGMPATSVCDGQDRLLGDNVVSGAVKRRGAVQRTRRTRTEGDFGRIEDDYLPKPKRKK